jgi:ectoine hydroxylase-related dioxygenase (phytanoyl-CoA dioxygenase family)
MPSNSIDVIIAKTTAVTRKYCPQWLRTMTGGSASVIDNDADRLIQYCQNIDGRLSDFVSRPPLNHDHISEFSQLSNFEIPKVNIEELTFEKIRDSMIKYGALVVVGAIKKDEIGILRKGIDDTRVDKKRVNHSNALISETVNYRRLPEKYNKGSVFLRDSVYLPESPSVFNRFFDILGELGVREHVVNYLGGNAALSVEKSVLRRAEPDNSEKWDYAWHQDGAFLGDEIQSLNLWVALSNCGEDAPSLDLITKRYNSILPTGTDRASYDWSLGPQLVESEIAEHGYEHLIINEGDIVFFDHFNAHRTGMIKGMTKPRYAIECWFFSEYGFPLGKTGLKL